MHGESLTENKIENVTTRTAKKWGLFALCLAFPVDFVVGHFTDPGRGRAAGVFSGLMIIALRAFWRLRQRAWFWMTVLALTAIHIVLISIIPWTNKSIPAPALWPVGIVDFGVIYGFIKLVEKAMGGGDTTSSPS